MLASLFDRGVRLITVDESEHFDSASPLTTRDKIWQKAIAINEALVNAGEVSIERSGAGADQDSEWTPGCEADAEQVQSNYESDSESDQKQVQHASVASPTTMINEQLYIER